MIEGLNQEAELRLKMVLEGLPALKRGVAEAEDMLGADMPKAIGETEQALIDLDRAFDRAAKAAKSSSRDQKAAAKEVGEAWEKAQKKLTDAQAAYGANARGRVTDNPSAGRSLSSYSEDQKTELLAIDDAGRANIIRDIRKERKERDDAAAAAEKAAQREAAAVARAAEIQRKEREKLSREVVEAEARMEKAIEQRIAAENGRARDGAKRDNRNASDDWTRQLRQAEEELASVREKSNGNLITERYALYDVASTAGIAALALGGLVTAYEGVAISRERAFADVTRVTAMGRDSAEAGALRDQLIELTKEIPQSFEDISKVTQLLAQQNVATPFLDEATEAVIKFATSSGIATDTVAEDLGKLSNILGLGAAGFDILGKSIAFAGAESAATEPQIIAVAKEIAPYARDAGFAAEETIGLATALASLAVPPERARSAIAALFTTIDRSVSSGGERLENFARVSGMSVEQFTEQWRSDPAAVFQSFIQGTSTITDLTGALDALGIDGRLAGTVIRALQSDTDLLAESFQNAGDGITNGFLDQSFAQIVDTVAEKLRLLLNAVQNLADSMGGPTLAALGEFITFLAEGANNLSAFIDGMGPAGGLISTVATVLIVLTAGLLALTGVLAGGTAAVFAIVTAITMMDGRLTTGQARVANFTLGLLGMKNAAITAAPAVAAVGTAGTAAGTGLTAAATGAKVLRSALVSTGIGAVLVLLGSVAGGFMETADTTEELTEVTEEATEAFEEETVSLTELSAELREAVIAANEFIFAQGNMEGSLYSLGQSMQKNGASFSAFSEGGRTNMRALETVISSTVAAAGGDAQLLANLLLGIQQQLIATGASGEAITIVQKAIDATGVSATKALSTSNSLAVGLNTVADSAKEARNAFGQLISEIRTVTDYSRELGGVLDRSFDIQFGPQAAYDRILSIYNKMREEADDAAKAVEDLRKEIRDTENDIAGLSADRKGQEYSLDIATKYGDTIRAAQIASDMAKTDQAIADGRTDLVNLNGELVTAEEARNRSLVGNTQAAIENREAMRELIAAQADYLTALAASGASQEEIAAAQAGLTTQFGAQTAALGFSAAEINGPYMTALANMRQVVVDFPRNVNIEITGLSAAEAALYESLARMQVANAEASQGMAADYGANLAKIAEDFNQLPEAAQESGNQAAEDLGAAGEEAGKNWWDSMMESWANGEWTWIPLVGAWMELIGKWWQDAGRDWSEGLWNSFAIGLNDLIRNAKQVKIGDWQPFAGLGYVGSNGGGTRARPGAGGSFAEGGFTGAGGKYDVAGLVHRNEYVSTQEDVRFWGVDTYARMHRVATSGGFANGGSTGGNAGSFFGAGGLGGGGPLSLTQDTIERIADAVAQRPAVLWGDGRALAQTASAGSADISRGL